MAMTRIMLVEDEVIIARDIQRSLEKLGYVVCAAATSGEEAVAAALAVKPDVILMDIMLQGAMDGVDAAREIRTRLDVPVIYLTAFADDKILERAKLTRPYGYIIKPFEDRELRSTIEMAAYKHRAEEALNKQREKFISVLIHDLKGPLLAISGYVRRLSEGRAEGVNGEEERRRICGIIMDAAQSMLSTIEGTSKSLREKAALEKFNPRPVNFHGVLRTVLLNYSPQFQERGLGVYCNGVRVEDLWADAGGSIHADPEQLRSMIENLVGNAVKYARSAIHIDVSRDGAGLKFAVSDDGPGIPEVYREKIFEEYFQAPGSVKGTGLGLFSVKKVVNNHGGGVAVTSLPDGGTRFEITLPL
jgi:signal transduction histidine kinase